MVMMPQLTIHGGEENDMQGRKYTHRLLDW